MTIGRVQTTYHDIILRGPRRFDWRGRKAHTNFWGERSRWPRRSIKFDRTVIEPHDSERFENRRFYLGRGDKKPHCRTCMALQHPFHERRFKARLLTGGELPNE